MHPFMHLMTDMMIMQNVWPARQLVHCSSSLNQT